MIYFLVLFSLTFSIGFLAVFFWAVENDQFQSLLTAPWSILEEGDEVEDDK